MAEWGSVSQKEPVYSPLCKRTPAQGRLLHRVPVCPAHTADYKAMFCIARKCKSPCKSPCIKSNFGQSSRFVTEASTFTHLVHSIFSFPALMTKPLPLISLCLSLFHFTDYSLKSGLTLESVPRV